MIIKAAKAGGDEKVKSSKGVFKLFFERYISKNEFFRNKIIIWLLSLNLAANIVNWLCIFVLMNRLDIGIILHYNVYFGVDSIGDWKQTLVMPVIGLILLALNANLAAYFYIKKERIASYILLLASFMAQINLIIATSSVIMINY